MLHRFLLLLALVAIGHAADDNRKVVVLDGSNRPNGLVAGDNALLGEGSDLVVGTATGTKIGTATSQKLAFFNSTPIVQPSGATLTALSNLGLIASPTLAASDISSGILASARGGTGISNAGTITNATDTTITGGGTLALGGFTFTVPATGTAGLLGTAQTFTGDKTFSGLTTLTGAVLLNNDVSLGAVAGTKWGTTTVQKQGWWNATPIAQPSGNALTALANMGLIASPTLVAGDITGGTLAIGRGGTGVSNSTGSLTFDSATTIGGGGTITLGGFTLTVPATGTAALLATANAFTAAQTITTSAAGFIVRNSTAGSYADLRVYNDQNSGSRMLELAYTGSTYASAFLSGTNAPSGEQGVVVTAGAYPLVFGTNNTYRAQIDSSGTFWVDNATLAAVFRQSSTTGYVSQRWYNDQNSGVRALEQGYSGSAYASAILTSGIVGESGYLTTTGNYPLQLGTNNTARVTISGAGVVNVLNTTDATTKDLGSIVSEGGIAAEKAIVAGTTMYATTGFTLASGNFLLGNTGQTIYATTGDVFMRGGTGGELRLGAGGTNDYLRISSAGVVSIANTSASSVTTVGGFRSTLAGNGYTHTVSTNSAAASLFENTNAGSGAYYSYSFNSDTARGFIQVYSSTFGGGAPFQNSMAIGCSNATGNLILYAGNAVTLAMSATVIDVTDAVNFKTGTTTGTKIGTATTQKLGFWNATPIAQPSSTGEATGFTAGAGTAVNDASTFTGNVGATAYRISDIVKHLKNIGVIAP